MPRNIASVPSVTTSDGRPRPGDQDAVEGAGSGAGEQHQRHGHAAAAPRPGPARPSTTLVSARMLATDRSISRAMISSTSGSDQQRLLRHAGGRLRQVEGAGEVGHGERRRRPARPAPGRPGRSPSWPSALTSQRHRAHRGAPACARDDEGVDADGDQDHQAVDALQPERVDPDQGQPVLDHEQRQRAERHAEHRARAAADGDAADDDRGDHGQLEAERHAGIDGGVARGPQARRRSRRAGRQQAKAPSTRRSTRMPISCGAVRVRADGVELAADRRVGAARRR